MSDKINSEKLLALVGKWRALDPKVCGNLAAEDFAFAADELAPIATALCAEVEALTVAAKSARRALARAAQMDPAFNGAYQELDAAIDAAKEPK